MINSQILFPPKCGKVPCETIGDACNLYNLTNNARLFGATTILYLNVLKTIGEQIGSDFYIIPSSINEVLIYPIGDSNRNLYSISNLNKIVVEINKKEVSESEILSEHVYFYDRVKEEMISCDNDLELLESM